MKIDVASERDLPGLLGLYNHYIRESPATFDTVEQTPGEKRDWFLGFDSSGPYRLLVGRDGAELLGFACSTQFHPRCAYHTSIATSIYVGPDHTRKGIGTRLYQALFEALAEEPLHRAYAGITLPNPASIALHEQFGFKLVGRYHEVGYKFGKRLDVHLLELVLEPEHG